MRIRESMDLTKIIDQRSANLATKVSKAQGIPSVKDLSFKSTSTVDTFKRVSPNKYNPDTMKLKEISNAVSGKISLAIAPSFKSSKEVETDLFQMLSGGKAISEQTIFELAQQKARVSNFNSLIMQQ